MRLATNGNTIFRCLRKSLAHYATAHPLRRCHCRSFNYKPLYAAESGNKGIGSWLKAAVPTHGLETVLGSVNQLLDSGVTSLEQVLNVLSRLNDTPIPAQVETRLKLNEEPLADTARYDSLTDKEVFDA